MSVSNDDLANDDLDALIMAAASAEWQKVALLISAVFDALAARQITTPAQTIAERIYALADSGKLDSGGNLRRWRDGTVRVKG
ncbi:MAG: hypothetical protein KJ017_00265 [Alphaproteobacteria bacterium]|nr:hypothetical protein [Alphaproteobacteria bacterium]